MLKIIHHGQCLAIMMLAPEQLQSYDYTLACKMLRMNQTLRWLNVGNIVVTFHG